MVLMCGRTILKKNWDGTQVFLSIFSSVLWGLQIAPAYAPSRQRRYHHRRVLYSYLTYLSPRHRQYLIAIRCSNSYVPFHDFTTITNAAGNIMLKGEIPMCLLGERKMVM